MWGRLGPRFALEAGFLILVAVGLGLTELDRVVIVAVMGGAWLIVSLIELAASREASLPRRVRRGVLEAPAVDVPAASPSARPIAVGAEAGPGPEVEPAPQAPFEAPEPVGAPPGEATEEQPVVREARTGSDTPEELPLGEPLQPRPPRRWFWRRRRAEDTDDSPQPVDREPVPAGAETRPRPESPPEP